MRAYLVTALVATTLSSPAWALYQQTNLVSDLPGEAAHQDPNLKNPWGVSNSPGSPFWVSDNMTGVATIYGADGTPNSLVVTVPPPNGAQTPSAPTGQVYNPTSGFALPGGSASLFLFATEDGTISGWNGASGSNAVLAVDNSASGAVYKGLALAGTDLYATNFRAGTIDVFDSNFAQVSLLGFTDPTLPSGYAPFNIQSLGGLLYVTFALQDASKANDVPGPGHGFVDVFDTSGTLQRRLVSNGSLNSPWGLALAPANFGDFSNALLVGNFGDGTIQAYDPATGALLGTLQDGQGHTIQNVGLWTLKFGGGTAANGATNTLFFTAGIPGPDAKEDHGLFGSLTSVPEPGTLLLVGAGVVGLAMLGRKQS